MSTQIGQHFPEKGIPAAQLFAFIGNRIRDFRAAFGKTGLSQEALAKMLSVATNTISRWETATYRPSLEDLDKLSRVLNKSLLDFFPNEQPAASEKLNALLRAAKELDPDDLDELRRYAEYRKARALYGESAPKAGRPRKNSKNEL